MTFDICLWVFSSQKKAIYLKEEKKQAHKILQLIFESYIDINIILNLNGFRIQFIFQVINLIAVLLCADSLELCVWDDIVM